MITAAKAFVEGGNIPDATKRRLYRLYGRTDRRRSMRSLYRMDGQQRRRMGVHG